MSDPTEGLAEAAYRARVQHDWAPSLVLADWLQEQGNPIAHVIRLAHQQSGPSKSYYHGWRRVGLGRQNPWIAFDPDLKIWLGIDQVAGQLRQRPGYTPANQPDNFRGEYGETISHTPRVVLPMIHLQEHKPMSDQSSGARYDAVVHPDLAQLMIQHMLKHAGEGTRFGFPNGPTNMLEKLPDGRLKIRYLYHPEEDKLPTTSRWHAKLKDQR